LAVATENSSACRPCQSSLGGLAEAGVIAARTGRFFRGEPLENVVTTT
jgi:hypothetical protein